MDKKMRVYVGFITGKKAYVYIRAKNRTDAWWTFKKEYGIDRAGSVVSENDFELKIDYYKANGYCCEGTIGEAENHNLRKRRGA